FKAAKFWRTRTGEEIDLILEIWGEKTIAIEIKASSTPKSTDFKNIEKYRVLAKDKFAAGIVFYLGERMLSYQNHPNLAWFPLDLLWS
ncbi:MAG: DUF4143 domain-containing protein, partial [Bifidobacteriaceae bacterium]|nr:DUF4143 domain-containing protein [Bifidobacteriaceae bacterium]